MKKLILIATMMAMLLIIPKPCPAADRACQPIWDDVAGQTYVLVVDDQSFDVVFSGSYVGPCPQGELEIYDGIYIAPILKCRYTSGGDNLVNINCGGDDIPFILRGNKLELYVPSDIVMERKVDDD